MGSDDETILLLLPCQTMAATHGWTTGVVRASGGTAHWIWTSPGKGTSRLVVLDCWSSAGPRRVAVSETEARRPQRAEQITAVILVRGRVCIFGPAEARTEQSMSEERVSIVAPHVDSD
jgi:hypothetical protein